MNRKKKFFKVLLLLLLLGIIGFEVFFLLNNSDGKELNNSNNNTDVSKEDDVVIKDNSKYIVDVTTPYNKNGLKFEYKKEGNGINYYTISGLKDTELEKKINDSIVKKINDLKNKVGESKIKSLAGEIEASFENVLSISFDMTYIVNGNESARYFDSLNIDLTTGNSLTLEDIVNDKDLVKTSLVDYAYNYAYRKVGFICSGGPCENPNPDYSGVEDTALLIAQKFINDEYVFYFTPSSLVINFTDVDILDPEEVYDEEEEKDKACYKFLSYEDEEGEKYYSTYCDFYEHYISIPVYFYDQSDNVIIYDKFKSEENIFRNDLEVISRKFIESEAYGDSWDSYLGSYFIEEDSDLFDYVIDSSYFEENDFKIADIAKKDVLREARILSTDAFDIYHMSGKVTGIGNYYYVYFDVLHYSMSKDEYLKVKKDIYLNKLNGGRIIIYDGLPEFNEEGYEFLKDKKPEKKYYFYIYDKNGNSKSCKEIIADDVDFSQYIPNEWLTLGNYKTVEELVDNAYFIYSENVEIPDRLVIFYNNVYVTLKYKGKEVTINDYTFASKMFK